MSNQPFEEDQPTPAAEGNDPAARLVVDLTGFEGPIDVLLQLARDQKVDITRLSILELAEQYLVFVRAARRLRLELAADYLVMAAWLAYLKSRLLLPEPESDADEPSGAEMAAALRFQLQRLQAMREAGESLNERPRLGVDVFPRGAPEEIPVDSSVRYDCSLYELLRAYGRQHAKVEGSSLRIDPMDLFSVEEAIARLRTLIGATPEWLSLAAFLPEDLRTHDQGMLSHGTLGLGRRSAVAATFAASLELCREGHVEIRQDDAFGPIYLRAGSAHRRGNREGTQDDEGGGNV